MKIIVTGGAGFIGSALVRYLINDTDHHVLNIDALTYAGNLESLGDVSRSKRYKFEHANICDAEKMDALVFSFQPDLIMHLAAESHVDRSIDGPAEFIHTNVVGTLTLLQAARRYWDTLNSTKKENFRFLHVSTDEVYGELGQTGLFTEETPYAPSSPYSASKASSDHLARAWHRTYGLPVVVTNCSNNYGPFQFPEKLIPLVILNALEGKPIPVYGDGQQVRDWLYVEDHVKALLLAASTGEIGETYNIGGCNEKTNLHVVNTICDILETQAPAKPEGLKAYRDLITFVSDRPGHDFRYAIDASKIQSNLGWCPEESFESGIEKTVTWYLQNSGWCQNVLDGSYARDRLGII